MTHQLPACVAWNHLRQLVVHRRWFLGVPNRKTRCLALEFKGDASNGLVSRTSTDDPGAQLHGGGSPFRRSKPATSRRRPSENEKCSELITEIKMMNTFDRLSEPGSFLGVLSRCSKTTPWQTPNPMLWRDFAFRFFAERKKNGSLETTTAGKTKSAQDWSLSPQ